MKLMSGFSEGKRLACGRVPSARATSRPEFRCCRSFGMTFKTLSKGVRGDEDYDYMWLRVELPQEQHPWFRDTMPMLLLLSILVGEYY